LANALDMIEERIAAMISPNGWHLECPVEEQRKWVVLRGDHVYVSNTVAASSRSSQQQAHVGLNRIIMLSSGAATFKHHLLGRIEYQEQPHSLLSSSVVINARMHARSVARDALHSVLRTPSTLSTRCGMLACTPTWSHGWTTRNHADENRGIVMFDYD
jgi:hypothetical protein